MARPRTRPRDLFGNVIAPRRGRAEDKIQGAVVDYVRRCVPSVRIAHAANGGWRSKGEAGRFRYLGVLAGFPDLIVLLPESRVALWECKAQGGRLSREQAELHDDLARFGHAVAIVMSIDDAKAELAKLGIKTREVPQ